MSDQTQETIASRFVRLNQLLLGKSSYNIPKKYLLHRDGLLDALCAFYEECNVDYLRKDKHIANFVDKFKGVMIELKSLRVNLKDFEVKKIIGRGHFGEVQVVREKATGDVYAMKVLRKQETLSQQNVAFYKEERDIMAKSTSPWLTKLQYAFQDNQNLYLIMEFHPGGDMLSLLEKYDNVLPEDMCQFYLAELVLAIHSLHTMGYVHRDIKPDNILIDRTGHIKLADFGSASKLNPHKQVISSMPVGTPDYVAPEVLTAMNAGPSNSKSYGVECDWWSLGIVTYEMVFGCTPFASEKVLVTYNNIMNFKNSLNFPPEESEVSEMVIDLIKNLLQEASVRFGYDQLVVHPLFLDIDWNNIRHTAPPFVPNVSSVDDTSNFDDFEPENRPSIGDLKSKREFTGKNLPFIGFTYTSPFETHIERCCILESLERFEGKIYRPMNLEDSRKMSSRLSSADDSSTFSPCSSLDFDSLPRKREITTLQSKVFELTDLENQLKRNISNLKRDLESKTNELESCRNEQKMLEHLVSELQAEVKQVKQLLSYEREHRVLIEQKGVQLVRCMKTKHRQDALRLKMRSQEFNKDNDEEKLSLQEQLEDAHAKIDEFLMEKVELIESLQDTKFMLLECQKKLHEKEQKLLSFTSDSTLNESETSSSSTEVDLKQVVKKLEKKNISLEKELETATSAKEKAEAQAQSLKKAIVQLENEMKEMEKENFEISCQTQDEQLMTSVKKYEKELENKHNIIADMQKKLLLQEESTSQITRKLEDSIHELELYKEQNRNLEESVKQLKEEIALLRSQREAVKNNSLQEIEQHQKTKKKLENSVLELEEEISVLKEKKEAAKIPSTIQELKKPFEDGSYISYKSPSPDDGKPKQHSYVEHSDLKQENGYLKTRLEIINAELTKFKEDIKNKDNSCSDFTKQLKEKEKELSETKLDLKISTRKEQQAESVACSLRERNRDLREKIKGLEDHLLEASKIEKELREQVKVLEDELSLKKNEFTEKEKLHEIEKAKLEERVKTMKDTCETSSDINQKFAKSQGQYEEVAKQNENLLKECEEKDKTITALLEEIKILRSDLSQKQNECSKYKKVNDALKSTCLEMEEQLKDFEIIVEARGETIAELTKNKGNLEKEIRSLKESLKQAKSSFSEEEKSRDELLTHIKELTSEMESQNALHEAELQTLQDHLQHYKKVASELAEESAQMQKEMSLQDQDAKKYSEKILALETQLYEIKEEAARHITQISSLKASNLKLTQAINDALENQHKAQANIEDLCNELESEKVNHAHEKVKLKETISQQAKLIDFLQSKTENMEKRKRPHISRLFGKKDSTPANPGQYRDVEKLLETEKSRCRRLQDQLSQARAENMALQREISNLMKTAAANTEIPLSPMSRAVHSALTFSPNYSPNSVDSPVLLSQELASKFTKPPGMKHKIPHRFNETTCMRSIKCCACLDSVHFGRLVAKCRECSIMCHPKCASSLPNTCGLPSGYIQHFRSTIGDSSSENTLDEMENKISEGWVKMPKSNKQGWDRRYLKLIGTVLYIFENSEEKDLSRALSTLDFGNNEAKIVVTSAVSATELTYAATSDLPYVLKVGYIPRTTCWPERCLYIMALNFSDKQMWVSVLENLAESSQTEVDGIQKNKLVGNPIWTLKGDKLIEPNCTVIFDENIILIGAAEGLFVLKVINKFSCSLRYRMEGIDCIYQMACSEGTGAVILIHGEDRKLSLADLDAFRSALHSSSNQMPTLRSLADIKDCHLFALEENICTESPYVCIATSESVRLFQWEPTSKKFYPKKVIETNEPCSCIIFSQNSVIFGTDGFYELNLELYTVKRFLDSKDASLAGLVYGASQFRSFPIAIFQIAHPDDPEEYLLCFNEMGVFVNELGQRTRPGDMKWSRLPLSFAYQCPYIFVIHFSSVEVIEILPQHVTEFGIRRVMKAHKPQYMGSAHVEQSIFISSTHDRTVELILVEGKSIGSSHPNMQSDEGAALNISNSSSKGSTAESDGLDFSFSTSMNQSLEQSSMDQLSLSSKGSEESTNSQMS